MKAIVMQQPGGPEVLQPAEVERPTPGPGEILVRLKAAGINPVDTKLRSRGTYFPEKMPAILGCDGAGIVESVGEGVNRFQPGDAIYFFHGGIGQPPGNYAEYACLDQHYAAAMPEGIDFAQAAAAPLALITAWEALHDRARIHSGQSILIHAGAGGVGHVAIQIARAAGCRVLTTVSSEEKAEFVRSLGADVAINYRQRPFAEAVLEETGGDGVDVVLDSVGGDTFTTSFAATRPYGQVVTLLQPEQCDWKQARLRNLTLTLELMLSPTVFGWEAARRHQTRILEEADPLLSSGHLRLHLADTLPLEQAAEAHRRIEAGGMQGKLVLTVD